MTHQALNVNPEGSLPDSIVVVISTGTPSIVDSTGTAYASQRDLATGLKSKGGPEYPGGSMNTSGSASVNIEDITRYY